MTEESPLVSVIMPAYNAEKFIVEAIESVLSQTYSALELIVIDDCSTDTTLETALEYAKKDNRVRVIRNEKNSGVARTRNAGLDAAKGEFIALIDSDDLWLPEKLEKQMTVAENTAADIVYCSYGMIDENGQKKFNDFIVPAQTDYEHMLIKSSISCSTALLSAKMMEGHRFDPGYYHEDYVMWLSLLKEGYRAEGVCEVLTQYRIRNKSRSNNKIKSAQQRWVIYRDYLDMTVSQTTHYMFEYMIEGIRKYSR